METLVRPLSGTLGILGGGQLGKMLIAETSRLSIRTKVLDPDPECSSRATCSEFVAGDFRDRATVLAFAEGVDVMTIEIEQVNADALEELEHRGMPIYPQSAPLRIIQDKGLQKQFFEREKLPSPAFRLFQGKEEILAAVAAGELALPFVQKTRTAGYDGRGVQIVHTRDDLQKLLDAPSLVEDKVNLTMEIAVTAARSHDGVIRCFPAVEMVFDPRANLVETLACPARITAEQSAQAEHLAMECIRRLHLIGVLAVEMFLDPEGNIWINEMAPRPHNSGHHTIEACHTSQYGQHLRAILGLPLGDPTPRSPSAMWNLLGEPGHKGPARLVGMEEALAIPGVHVHVYGKRMTAPFRKMGHVTALGDSVEEALDKLANIRGILKVVT